jgi:HAE1 family hydrophobic/amphiphilic exporter-1
VKPPEPTDASGAMNRFIDRYGRFIAWSMHLRGWKRLYMVGIVLAMLIVPAASIGLVKFDAFPNDPDRTLFLPYWIEGEYSIERMEEVVFEVEDYLYENQEQFEFISVYSYFDLERAQSTILLRPDDERTKSAALIMEEIEANIPEIIIGQPAFNREQQGGTEGFSVEISGDSTDRLADLSVEVERLIESVDGLANARSDVSTGDREVRVVVDRERAQSYGLSTATIAMAVATAMRGENLREVRTGDGELAVRLAYRDTEQQTIEQLGQLPLYTPTNERITLETVADLSVTTGMRSIQRIDRQTSVTISADLVDTEMDTVRPIVEGLLNEMEMPAGYGWSFGRGFRRNDESQQMMVTNILLGVVMIFIVMAALFESMLYPLSIITSIVFSVLGVFLFFAVTGTTFTFMASIGIMILVGVVVNNGIVLVDHINNLRREGMPRDDAIIQGCRDRLRPILMTVATTILGLMPLAMGETKVGGGGPSYYPMARAIIGGLAYSTLASLLVVPSFYAWLDSLSRWTSKVKRVASGELARA